MNGLTQNEKHAAHDISTVILSDAFDAAAVSVNE